MASPLSITDFTYNTGTLTIANGDTTAVFSGSSLATNVKDGDYLFAGGSLAVIETVTDDTNAALFTAWAGADVTAGPYLILKASLLRYHTALIGYDSASFLAMLDGTDVWYVVEGTEPDPSIGEDGNWALKSNVMPWKVWLKDGGVWVEQAGSPGGDGDKGDQGDTGDAGADGTDGAPGADGADGVGVPVGGAAGQILAKIDGTDFNTEWIDPPEGDVTTNDIRERLTANRTYYVRTDGSDSNNGLANTSGGGIPDNPEGD